MKPLRRLHALGAFTDRRFALGLAAGIAAAAVYTSAQVAIPLVTGSLVDEGLLAQDRRALFRHVLLLVGAAALSTLGRGLYSTSFTWLAEKGRAQLQTRLLARLYELPLASFDRERTGRLQAVRRGGHGAVREHQPGRRGVTAVEPVRRTERWTATSRRIARGASTTDA